MHRKNLLRLAPQLTTIASIAGVALALAGCASTDGADHNATAGDGTAAGDDMTPEETAAAAAAGPAAAVDDDPATMASAGDGTSAPADVTPDADTIVTTPAEDSTPFLDPDELAFHDPVVAPGEIDPDNLNQTESCHRVTGYRSGHKMNICVTTIDGKYVEVNTARAYLRMRKAARKVGVHMYVVSGFRSMAEQRHLYHCYVTRSCNGGNLAAVPGYSNHQSGHALDLNTSAPGVYSYLVNHGHAFGFRRTVPTEKWHWEH